MSLIHWWQLNGDLKDYGTNPIDLTNIGATINDNGKIGKCYYLNGTNNALRAAYPNTIKPTDTISICGWYKASSTTTAHHIISCYEGGGAGLTAASDRSIMIMQVYTGGAYHDARTSFPDTNWHHWAGTFDGRYIKIYLDGVLKNTTDLGSGTHTISYNSTTPWMIGANPTPSGAAGGDYTNGYVNDIRIYDHALSLKEVKEISKGLVLDYNFEELTRENYLKTPLVTYSTNSTKTTEGNVVITGLDYTTLPGKTLILSYDYSVEGEKYYVNTGDIWKDRYGIHGVIQYTVNGTSYTSYPFAGYLTVSGTGRAIQKINIGSNWVVSSVSLANQTGNKPANNNTNTWYIKNVKLEIVPSSSDTASEFYGNSDGIIRDNSGYGNNATKMNDLADIGSGGPVGTQYFKSSTSHYCPYQITPSDIFYPSAFTVAAWAKFNSPTSNNQFIAVIRSLGGTRFFNLCLNGESNMQFGIFTGTTMWHCWKSFSSSDWNYWVGTFDGTTAKLYRNGELFVSASQSSYTTTIPSDSEIGGRYNPSAQTYYNSNVDIAEFKIYATALSEDDIKLEYQRKASIDRNGNLFSPEFIEDNTNIKITNTQITKAGQFVEGNTKTQFKETYDGNSNVILSNQIKEV